MANMDKTKDPWDNPKHVKSFTAKVEVLYMSRADMERAAKAGTYPMSEFRKYWDGKKGPQHLEEVAIHVPADAWTAFKRWLESWGHKGGSWYLGKEGYAVRAGGVNQHQDPLNVFFLLEG